MSRAIPATIGPHTIHLVPPLSARQRLAALGPFWAALDALQAATGAESRTLQEIGNLAVERDITAACAVLSMCSLGPDACGLQTVGRYLRAEFADAGGLRVAAFALLDELDAQEIPVADLDAAIAAAMSAGSQPTAAEVEHARGN